MRFLWAELRDFRNHRRTRLEPLPDGLIVVVGANGEGKSNLLEGMYFALALVSPRVAASQPLVRDGAPGAYVRAEVETAVGRVLVELEIPMGGATRVHVDRAPVRRKRDLRRRVRGVFFGPDDLDVVRGDPAHRRRFLDEAVVALWPLKEGVATAYDRALRQRNRLLKEWDGGGTPSGLEVWDAELVESGCALMRLRSEAVARLAPRAEEEFRVASEYGLTCRYRPSVTGPDPEEGFRGRLRERRGEELVRRTTLVGPHRDDLELAVRDLGARAFASHGEAWGAAVSLRMGLAEAVAEELGERPVLLLDDPLAPLDPLRQRHLGERLLGRGQVVVSVADEAHVPPGAGAIWDVAGGGAAERGG